MSSPAAWALVREHAGMRITVAPLQDGLPFARVSGFDLSRASSSSGEVLRSLMEEHGLLYFEGQRIEPAQEVLINEVFGYHRAGAAQEVNNFGWKPGQPKAGTVSTLAHLGMPSVQLQGKMTLRGEFGLRNVTHVPVLGYRTEGFHSDGMHDMSDHLPVLTSMHCHKTTERGGQTLFIDARLALRRADPETANLARRLRVHYRSSHNGLGRRGRPMMREGIVRTHAEYDEQLRLEGIAPDDPAWACDDSSPIHPLVRRHPVTGDESVYVSCGNLIFMEAPGACFGFQPAPLEVGSCAQRLRISFSQPRPPSRASRSTPLRATRWSRSCSATSLARRCSTTTRGARVSL